MIPSTTTVTDVYVAGTILQWLPRDYSGIIIGTGGDNQHYEFPKSLIVGVRGYRTLGNITPAAKQGVVGDPGLILNNVFPQHIVKKYRIGIVPHFVDREHKVIKVWKNRFGDQCLVIDVLRSPPKVITDIKACDYILSSSLHGLIVADAFDIQNARFVMRDTMPGEFYDYKFQDYYSSLDSSDHPLEADGSETLDQLVALTRLHKQPVQKLQKKLDLAFKSLSKSLSERDF